MFRDRDQAAVEAAIERFSSVPTEQLQQDLKTLTALDALAGGDSPSDPARRACWAVLEMRGVTPSRTLKGLDNKRS